MLVVTNMVFGDFRDIPFIINDNSFLAQPRDSLTTFCKPFVIFPLVSIPYSLTIVIFSCASYTYSTTRLNA